MDSLIRCRACRHGIVLHDTTGCTARTCRCAATHEQIIEDAVRDAHAEEGRVYGGPPSKEWWR